MALLLPPTLCWRSLLVVLTITTPAIDGLRQDNYTSNDEIVKRIFNIAIPTDYDPEKSPSDGTLIHASVEFLSIPSVQFSKMEIEVEFYFVASWKDDRLTFGELVQQYLNEDHWLKLPDIVKKRLWVPWINFPECKRCNDTYITGHDTRQMWLNVKTRELLLEFRDTMSFSCYYDLSFFPFDVHTCNIILKLDDTDRRLELVDLFSNDSQYQVWMPAEFTLDTLSVKRVCSARQPGPVDVAGQCLQYGVQFHRMPAYYLMVTFIPSFLVVMLSWITFWLSADAAAPRVILAMTSLLALTSEFGTAQKDLSPVDYVTALDVWMLMCVVMVVGSLLGFALAHNIPFQNIGVKVFVKRNEVKTPSPTFIAKKVKPHEKGRKALAREAPIKAKQANPLDATCRVLFPSIFVMFNVIYWAYYGRGG